jgi:hypothetical protein
MREDRLVGVGVPGQASAALVSAQREGIITF